MSFFDKIKTMVNISDEDYYEEEDQDIISSKSSKLPEEDYFSGRKPAEQAAPAPAFSTEKRNKYVNIPATTQLQVVLVKPERFDDAPSIADHLNNKRTVVLNLEAANREISRRLIDFLSGVAYANNGQIKKVANSTYIITPFNVDLMGDLILDELESSNMYI